MDFRVEPSRPQFELPQIRRPVRQGARAPPVASTVRPRPRATELASYCVGDAPLLRVKESEIPISAPIFAAGNPRCKPRAAAGRLRRFLGALPLRRRDDVFQSRLGIRGSAERQVRDSEYRQCLLSRYAVRPGNFSAAAVHAVERSHSDRGLAARQRALRPAELDLEPSSIWMASATSAKIVEMTQPPTTSPFCARIVKLRRTVSRFSSFTNLGASCASSREQWQRLVGSPRIHSRLPLFCSE